MFSEHQDAPSEGYCTHGAKRQYPIRLLLERVQCTKALRYLHRPHGNIVYNFVNSGSVDANSAILPSVCPIDPDFVYFLCVLSEIFNMPKNMAFPVLADKVSEVGPHSHIRYGQLVIAP